jgi:hypothetical protein
MKTGASCRLSGYSLLAYRATPEMAELPAPLPQVGEFGALYAFRPGQSRSDARLALVHRGNRLAVRDMTHFAAEIASPIGTLSVSRGKSARRSGHGSFPDGNGPRRSGHGPFSPGNRLADLDRARFQLETDHVPGDKVCFQMKTNHVPGDKVCFQMKTDHVPGDKVCFRLKTDHVPIGEVISDGKRTMSRSARCVSS